MILIYPIFQMLSNLKMYQDNYYHTYFLIYLKIVDHYSIHLFYFSNIQYNILSLMFGVHLDMFQIHLLQNANIYLNQLLNYVISNNLYRIHCLRNTPILNHLRHLIQSNHQHLPFYIILIPTILNQKNIEYLCDTIMIIIFLMLYLQV